MTPQITSRSFSTDHEIFMDVVFNNLYSLKGGGSESPSKTLVDIGAHAGFVSFLALTLGFKKVYAFEPYVDSFSLLLKNCYTPHYYGRFTPYQLGVYPVPIIGQFAPPEMIEGSFFDLASIGLATQPDSPYYPCQCVTLDSILAEYCFGDPIDVLKLNIGYAEMDILHGSSLLTKQVKAVCGVMTATDEQFLGFQHVMKPKGFTHFFSSQTKNPDRRLFWMSQSELAENFNV